MVTFTCSRGDCYKSRKFVFRLSLLDLLRGGTGVLSLTSAYCAGGTGTLEGGVLGSVGVLLTGVEGTVESIGLIASGGIIIIGVCVSGTFGSSTMKWAGGLLSVVTAPFSASWYPRDERRSAGAKMCLYELYS